MLHDLWGKDPGSLKGRKGKSTTTREGGKLGNAGTPEEGNKKVSDKNKRTAEGQQHCS